MSNTNRIAEIKKMLEESPEDTFLHYALALEYIVLGEIHNGMELLENIRAKSPDYLAVYMKLGKMYHALQDIPKAIEAIEQGIIVARNKQDFKTINELEQVLEDIKDDE